MKRENRARAMKLNSKKKLTDTETQMFFGEPAEWRCRRQCRPGCAYKGCIFREKEKKKTILNFSF